LLIDIHGEYGRALNSAAKVFRVNPQAGESALFVPYWALDINELLPFLLGKTEEKAITAISDKILAMKLAISKIKGYPGVNENSLTADSPIPFSLKKLWYELIDPEVKTWLDAARSQTAVTNPGAPETLTAPTYPLPAMGPVPPFANNVGVLSIRRQLDQLRSRLLDKQFDSCCIQGIGSRE
jgi:hypothetical protein